MKTSSHVQTHHERIQQLCNEASHQIAEQYQQSAKLVIDVCVSPSLDGSFSAISVLVGTEDGGMELPCISREIPEHDLPYVTAKQIRAIVESCVRQFLMLE
jgi:hypothetical protein